MAEIQRPLLLAVAVLVHGVRAQEMRVDTTKPHS